ncbi:MAG: YkgJ family cysteine cluster protein [bacterium]
MSFDDLESKLEELNEHGYKEDEFPQYLCNTCGKCCRSIATRFTFDELKEMAKEGEEEALVFTEIFKAFPSIEEARKVIPEQIDNVLKELATKPDFDEKNVTFFYCPHITDKNLCGIYEKRPGCCRRAPRHGWSVMPPGCGFEGWQFEQREKHKKTIRALKEYLYMAEMLSDDGKVPGRDMTIDELKALIESKITPWERFGSKFW